MGSRVAEQAELMHAVEVVITDVSTVLGLDSGLIDAGGDIRADMAREIHDQVLQTLYAMKVQLEDFRSTQYGRAAVLRELDLLEKLTVEVLGNLRQLIGDLRADPALQHGLIAGLRGHLIPRFERLSGQPVNLRVSGSWPLHMNEQAEVNVYRIIQEALNNIWRHARGRSVAIAFELIGSRAIVWVGDIGPALTDSTTPRVQGQGVLGMRERAGLLGGRLTMNAGPGGTIVRVSFPLANLLP